MVLDFGAFKRLVAEIADELDHTFLVEEGSLAPSTIAALEAEGFSLTILPFRTTAENLARWIFERLVERSLPVSQVEVDETPNNRAFYSRSPEAATHNIAYLLHLLAQVYFDRRPLLWLFAERTFFSLRTL